MRNIFLTRRMSAPLPIRPSGRRTGLRRYGCGGANGRVGAGTRGGRAVFRYGAGTVSTPELIAKKIELFGIKVGRFEVAQLIRRGAGPEAIADIADSYDLNLRNGMESGEARLAAEREHGYAPDRTVADATRSEDVDDEPDIDFGFPERELAAQIVMQEGGTRQEVREQFTDDDLDRIARDEADAAWQCPMATRWRTSWTVRKPHGPWSRPPSRPNSSPSISTTCVRT